MEESLLEIILQFEQLVKNDDKIKSLYSEIIPNIDDLVVEFLSKNSEYFTEAYSEYISQEEFELE
jgi:hypothetical protein